MCRLSCIRGPATAMHTRSIYVMIDSSDSIPTTRCWYFMRTGIVRRTNEHHCLNVPNRYDSQPQPFVPKKCYVRSVKGSDEFIAVVNDSLLSHVHVPDRTRAPLDQDP